MDDDDLFTYGGSKPLQFGSTLDDSVDNTGLLLELEDSDSERDGRKRRHSTDLSGKTFRETRSGFLRDKKRKQSGLASDSGGEDDSKYVLM